MIIRNIRTGSDNGGFACGPSAGSDYVEVMGQKDDGTSVFALVSVFEDNEKLMLSPVSLIDIVTHMGDRGMDFDAEWTKAEKYAQEEIDYPCSEAAEAIADHPYATLINVARMVMKEYLQTDPEDDEPLQELVQALVDQDVNNIDMKFVDSVLADDDEVCVVDKDGKYLAGYTIDDCHVDEVKDMVEKEMMEEYGLPLEVEK